MSDERRRESRLRILGALQGDVTIVQPVRIIDISEGGASVEVERALALESLHDVRLALNERSAIVKARVAYCRISDIWPDHVIYRAGLEFVEVSPHAREAIAAYIAETAVSRQGR
jgi:c-di-GMP-binding flagellar brake protein YcgR